MSTLHGPDIAALIQSAQSQRRTYSVQFCSLALLYYDYSLTFRDEVNYIWKNPWRLSTLLYIFCRYALAANLIYVLAISSEITGLE
ncbi:hypothetical protein CC2G_007975 [Coprinopsis cinerea AmutBmut pab1-1]|nr:hypothetical protein CC2G_007975 [Coprinopsis cinerea AmutBmut pab1-1]